jgi:SAM-dependent methyltransferase
MSLYRRLSFNFRYLKKPPWDTDISPPELISFIDSTTPGNALDLGCGTGTNVLTLAKRGWQVIGVDFAWRAILTGRRRARRAGLDVDLRIGDVTRQSDLVGSFDLILDMGCLHGLNPDQQIAYQKNLERWLSSSGTYMLYAFIQQDSKRSGPGLLQADIEAINRRLVLVTRQDSGDRGGQPSAWLTYRRSR